MSFLLRRLSTAVPSDIACRPAEPSDYELIFPVLDQWFGRPMTSALPRLFLDHFHSSSTVATWPDGSLAGFLIGFLSPSLPDEAYIHFIGVHPDARGEGLARSMYERFFDVAVAAGRNRVRAITSPVNKVSIAFHSAMGFTVDGPVPDYHGPGVDLMVFTRRLP